MTEQEQRISIAEACGWTDIVFRGVFDPKERDYIGHHSSCRPSDYQGGVWSGPIPDYLHDLNAIHEVENSASPEYWRELAKIVAYGIHSIEWRNLKLIASATAAQRSEAFLRAIGKWKE